MSPDRYSAFRLPQPQSPEEERELLRAFLSGSRRFRMAESDRAPAVRESAKKGLEITARMRARPTSVP